MTTRDDLVSRLLANAEHHRDIAGDCDCRPEDTVNWQHNLNCQEAISALEAKDAEIARLNKCYDLAIKSRLEWREQAERLERQLAEETERCAPTSSRDAYGLFTRQERFSLPMELRRRWWQETEYGSKPASDELITEAKTAIRGGAK